MVPAAVSHPSTISTDVAIVAIVSYGTALIVFDQCLSTRASLDTLIQYLLRLRDSWGFRPGADDVDWRAREQQTNRRIAQALRDVGVVNPDPPQGRRAFRPWRISAPRVLAGWRQAHAIERLVWRNAPTEHVRSRLQVAAGELKAIQTVAGAASLADVSRVLHEEPTPARRRWLARLSRLGRRPAATTEQPLAQAALRQALFVIHDDRDTLFESLADQQRKSVWLALFGLALIVVVATTLHRETLFLLGAVGGFLSRLGRLLARRALFTDYGSSAASVILAPVSGALSGWMGLLLLSFLSHVGVVTHTYGRLWDRPMTVDALALAFVFGFSERFLARVVSSVEGTVGHK